jgi:hypothetical protein
MPLLQRHPRTPAAGADAWAPSNVSRSQERPLAARKGPIHHDRMRTAAQAAQHALWAKNPRGLTLAVRLEMPSPEQRQRTATHCSASSQATCLLTCMDAKRKETRQVPAHHLVTLHMAPEARRQARHEGRGSRSHVARWSAKLGTETAAQWERVTPCTAAHSVHAHTDTARSPQPGAVPVGVPTRACKQVTPPHTSAHAPAS